MLAEDEGVCGDMAILLSESEQIAALFEFISDRDDWVFLRIAFQYWVAKDNDFATWVEGFVDIYETDLKQLVQDLEAFVKSGQAQPEFRFEPVTEPDFQIRLQTGSAEGRKNVMASVALDLKRVMEMTIPTAYRENRIMLQLDTDWDRPCRFAEEFSVECRESGEVHNAMIARL